MKKLGMISEAQRMYLLDTVMAKPWRHVTTDGDFYAQKGGKVGEYEGRVVRLAPHGWLHPHTDDGNIKTHIVLLTNPDAITFCDEIGYFLELGGIYEFDASLVHSAVNNGETDRIHLVL